MTTKLFITGVTGYIGGDALYAVAEAYPTLEITALVRNSDKGAKVGAQHAKVKLVYGDLDSTDLLVTEASKADVVLHCADADHSGAAKALIAGLAQKKVGQVGYLIHTSGTGVITIEDLQAKTHGVQRLKVYDDWEGIGEVTSLPDEATHRDVDKIILGASKQHSNVYTAIVCPPCIYGPGRGPDNQKSLQAYRMAKATLQRGKGFQILEGKNTWSEVHVQDLSNVYLSLVEAALSPGGGKATWNDKGYYFAENGHFVWGDVARAIAKAAHAKKLIDTAEIDSITAEEADKLTHPGSYFWGTNSWSKAIRARNLFGWTPKQKGLFDLLPDIVDLEAKGLELTKGHAAHAAGDA